MTVYLHRRDDGTIASVHAERQDGYADEAMADTAPAVAAFMAAACPPARITVSRLRFKLELASRNLLTSVAAAVQAAGATPQLYWAEATEFESDHALVLSIGAGLGLDAAAIRAMFESAAAREV